MSRLLEDIRQEPRELGAILERFCDPGFQPLWDAAALIRGAPLTYIVGIGSSWNAGLAVSAMLQRRGVAVTHADASELLHSGSPMPGAVALVLSRSGQSVEVVRLLTKFQEASIRVIAITNTADSPLTRAAEVCLQLGARFDHLISITMYSGLALAGGLIAEATRRSSLADLTLPLASALQQTSLRLEGWGRQLENSSWLDPDRPAYFLARGSSSASSHEARLLWEEAAKRPACALTTGGFRHGSQEMVAAGTRIALWIDGARLRAEDLRLADDLQSAGAQVLLVGHGIPPNSASLILDLPPFPDEWQFAGDIVPLQLAAERLASLGGSDCDRFRLCPYVIESEGGLALAGRNQREPNGSEPV